MQKVKKHDGDWWVEDDNGLRRATDLEIDLWQRLVAMDDLLAELKAVIRRMIDDRIAYAGSLVHLVGAVHRAKREELRVQKIGAPRESIRRSFYFARTLELTQALTASSQLIGKALNRKDQRN